MAAMQREAAGEARHEADRVEPPGRQIDGSQFAGAGIQDIQPAVMQPRRVGHCQAAAHDGVCRHVQDHAAADPPISPGARRVAVARRRQVRRPAGFGEHRQAVEVTAVARRHPRDERWFPGGAEAHGIVDRGEAGERGVHEHRPSRGKHADVMGEHIAGEPGGLRDIDGVVAFQVAALGDHVLEPPDRVQAREIETLPRDRNAQAALEGALGDAQLVVGGGADQEQFADLIGADRQREAGFGEESREPVRGLDRVRRCRISGGDDFGQWIFPGLRHGL